ncbi:hypothetical protein QFC21_002692 [Naganishia friedmannii]|uniref:Uncharacterized protein n=1 Tax=Naganishia friedmannii TaxID=89922 RepID=A0ACC2VUZ9_9TREE|nr:hypothetical protein QFC21_002692 [Naganishia friedmannii]
MSGLITNPYFKKYFNQPTSVELGNMVAILEIGAFITSLLAAPLADAKGRRFTVRLGAIVFSIGGAVQTFTQGYRSMCIGRIISGFGVGMLRYAHFWFNLSLALTALLYSMIVPIYQSEISPAEHRGRLACIEFTGNIVGYASSIWIDYFCSFITSDLSWRIPLFIQCLGGIILASGTLVIPESPRFLIDTDQDEEGLRVIANFHDGNLDDPITRSEFTEIKEAILADRAVGDRSYAALFRRYKGRVFLAMSSQAFAQMNGINIVSYYAPLVFEQAGFIGRDAILMTGWNSLFYMASSIVPWMAVALTAIGWFIRIDQSFTPMAVYFVYPETAGVPLEEMDALFGDESNEKDENDDNDDVDDDDDNSSYTQGSGTPGSSLRSGSTSSFRRNNSSTPLVGQGGGPMGMMKRILANMRKKDTGTGSYNQLQH